MTADRRDAPQKYRPIEAKSPRGRIGSVAHA
jgi:hypothetical protein